MASTPRPRSPTALAPQRPWHLDPLATPGFLPLVVSATGRDTGVVVAIDPDAPEAAYDTAELICQWSRQDTGQA